MYLYIFVCISPRSSSRSTLSSKFLKIYFFAGLVSMILLIVSVPAGLIIKYYKEVKSYVPVRPIWWKTIHNILGLLGYIIGIISLCYGYYTHWFVYFTDYESRLVALIVTILTTLWTLNGACVSLVHQIKSLKSWFVFLLEFLEKSFARLPQFPSFWITYYYNNCALLVINIVFHY